MKHVTNKLFKKRVEKSGELGSWQNGSEVEKKPASITSTVHREVEKWTKNWQHFFKA